MPRKTKKEIGGREVLEVLREMGEVKEACTLCGIPRGVFR